MWITFEAKITLEAKKRKQNVCEAIIITHEPYSFAHEKDIISTIAQHCCETIYRWWDVKETDSNK